jgi:uncharacterized protein
LEELHPDVRKIIFRFGSVLGMDAKIIQKLIPLFKFGLGAKIGSGKQPFPFIHIDDLIHAFLWVTNRSLSEGIYNLVAPESIDNKYFTISLAHTLHRPAWFTVPEFILNLLFGEMSVLLLQNPQVYPERLLSEGFQFKYGDIESCLEQITEKERLNLSEQPF